MTCPGCHERDQQITALERDLRAKRSEITRLRNQIEPKPDPEIEAKVRDVFYYWVEQCRAGRASVKLTTDRSKRVRQRLADGYEVSFIKRAIDGAAAKPTTVDGKVYDDLELICRDGRHLEDHERRGTRGPDLMSKLVGA